MLYVNLSVSNYNETETTRANLQYDVTLLSNSTDLYSVMIDGNELTKEVPYELSTIQGREQRSEVHTISVQAKRSSIETEEKITLQVHGQTEGELSREDVQNIEISIMPKTLYWNSDVSSSTVELNVDSANVSLITQNYEDNNITASNIEYEISLENKDRTHLLLA